MCANHEFTAHEVEERLDIWHDLQQCAVDSEIDGESVFAPAVYRLKEDILNSDSMLIE